MCSLESAMKEEAGEMRGTLTNIEDKVPGIRKSIEAIRTTSESLGHKEEDLDDQINDTFDQLVARLEQRRTCLLNQLHFRVASKREKLGRSITSNLVFMLVKFYVLDLQMKNLEDNLADVLSSCEYVDQAIENATPTQLLLVRKQVRINSHHKCRYPLFKRLVTV